MATDLSPERRVRTRLALAAFLAVAHGQAIAQNEPPGVPPAGAFKPLKPLEPLPQQPPLLNAPDGGEQINRRRNIDFEFGVTVGATYSDNVLQQPEGSESKGTLIEVSPFVTGTFDNGRSRAQIRASAGGRQGRSEGETRNQVVSDLRTDADLLVGGDLRVAADAVYARTAGNELLGAQNALGREPTVLTNIGIAPYLSGRFDRGHFYEARYSLRGIDPGNDEPSNLIQRLGLELRSDPDAQSNLGWGIYADLMRARYENANDPLQVNTSYKNNNVDLMAFYRLNDTWRMGVGVNATEIDILANADGDTSGFGPTVYLNHALNNRRNLGLRWTDTYYGTEASANGWLRSRNWIGGFEYTKGIEDGNAADTLVLNTRDFLRPKNRIARTLAGDNEEGPPWERIEDISVLVATGGLGTALVDQEKAVIAGGYDGLRNSAVLAVFRNRVKNAVADFDGNFGNEADIQGLKLILGHKFTLRQSLDFTVELRDLNSIDPDQSGKSTTVALAFTNRLTESAATTIVVQTYKKSDTPNQNGVRENAVSLFFTYRF
ncbi:MAG: hypothetical protein R3E87_12290 [Burkholderiaceae bacterium]